MDCIFCSIINGDIPCEKIYEDDEILAFDDINPVAPVHVLIIPKKHYDSLVEVDNMDIIAKIHSVINKVAKQKGVDKSGFRVVTNCKGDAGQEVKHIHYHLIGGKQLNPLNA